MQVQVLLSAPFLLRKTAALRIPAQNSVRSSDKRVKLPVTIRHRTSEVRIYAPAKSFKYYRISYSVAGKRRMQNLWLATFEDNCHSFHTLATLRDTLLPNLLSGELAVGAPLRESIFSKESVAAMPSNKDGMGPMDSPKEPAPR